MPGGSEVSSLLLIDLRATRAKIDKYSGLTHSHAPLSIIITRALISTLYTRKLHCQNATKLAKLIYRAQALSGCISLDQDEERRKLSSSRREDTKDVSATSQSTYNASSKVRGSKMPGGSQVSKLKRRSLKESSKKWNRSSIQGWLNIMPHCPLPPLEL